MARSRKVSISVPRPDDRVREAKGPQVAGQSRPGCRGVARVPAQLDSGFRSHGQRDTRVPNLPGRLPEELLGRSVTATRLLSATTRGRCGLAATAEWPRLASRRLLPFASTHRAWPVPTRRGGRLVFGEITSLMAMLALVRPSQSNSSTSCSRWVRPSGFSRVAARCRGPNGYRMPSERIFWRDDRRRRDGPERIADVERSSKPRLVRRIEQRERRVVGAAQRIEQFRCCAWFPWRTAAGTARPVRGVSSGAIRCVAATPRSRR